MNKNSNILKLLQQRSLDIYQGVVI